MSANWIAGLKAHLVVLAQLPAGFKAVCSGFLPNALIRNQNGNSNCKRVNHIVNLT
ncbi:MAG: hypothetical protein K8S54_09965 [Spirochaetia bacterium]|nr:hypothetical protein [Spirochaetia bacterium]